jgi:Tfp pilus assembly protein PilO
MYSKIVITVICTAYLSTCCYILVKTNDCMRVINNERTTLKSEISKLKHDVAVLQELSEVLAKSE